MKYCTFLVVCIVIISCHGRNLTANKDSESTDTSRPQNGVKQFSDVKIDLLDARYEKAELLLGKPDVRGRIMDGLFYYTIYYSKVIDKGRTKHLVLFVDGKNGINDRSPIYKMEAVDDGEIINRAGNFAQWLKVSKAKVESNATDFSTGEGSNSWLDVDYSGSGTVTSKENIVGDTRIISDLSDLPAPISALKNKQVNKYKILKHSAVEIFNWYVEHYKAKRIDGSGDSFSIPYYSDNDSCIHINMTGLLDGVRIEFSFECDGEI